MNSRGLGGQVGSLDEGGVIALQLFLRRLVEQTKDAQPEPTTLHLELGSYLSAWIALNRHYPRVFWLSGLTS